MSLIPATRPVLGEDLDALRDFLGLSTMDACWLYGMSMTKWMTVVKKNSKEQVGGATLAILARALDRWPETCPLPKFPKAHEVFEMIHAHSPKIDKKRLAIMFGCEASSGYRWITVGSKIAPALMRLFEVFKRLYGPAARKSPSAALSVLSEWERMVEHEATQRGVASIFATGRWTQEKDTPLGRPVLGEDLDILRDELGLSTMDACWLYGMSMTKWMTVVKRNGKEPIRNVTLALLVRALQAHKEAVPLPPDPKAADVYAEIHGVQPKVDKKRMAVMFGCEASSGYRWLTMGSKISPVLARTFTVFSNRFAATGKRSPSAQLNTLKDWDHLVEIEGQARGVNDVFAVGRWLPKPAGDQVRLPRARRSAKSATAAAPRAEKAKTPAAKSTAKSGGKAKAKSTTKGTAKAAAKNPAKGKRGRAS